MKVIAKSINKDTPAQFYILVNEEENQVLYSAPNNWKSKKGALRWAVKHGFEI